MTSYVDTVVGRNERIAFRAKLHWMIYVWPIFWTVVTFGFALPITAIWLIIAIIQQITTDLAVTDKRLIAKTGLVARNVIELRLTKVESLRINQGIFGRIFNYGTLIVTGSGISATRFGSIADPLTFKRAVEDEIERQETAGPSSVATPMAV